MSSIRSMLASIGNTPIVRLRKIVPEPSAEVLVKLDYYNPTGSYKDRMALAMIEGAEARGELRPGMTVVEFTGGSTGSSLAFVCAVKGYRFKVVSSDAFAPAKLDTMRAFGAEVHLVPSDGGRITPDLIPRMMERAREIQEAEGAYWTINSTIETPSTATARSEERSSRSSTAPWTSSAGRWEQQGCWWG
jgi:cysteine synthase